MWYSNYVSITKERAFIKTAVIIMNEYDAKSIYQGYKAKCFYVAIAFIIVDICLFSILDSFLPALCIFMILNYLCIIITNKFAKADIYSALAKDFDPYKYKAIIDAGKIRSLFAFEKLDYAFYAGDFQLFVDIITMQLKKKSARKYVPEYLKRLAVGYFILQDLDGLRMVCDQVNEIVKQSRNPERLAKRFPMFHIHELYLNGNYTACKELFEKRLTDKKYMSSKWGELHTRFYYAIHCYKCGDIDNAKENFNFVVNTAPKLSFTAFAKKYLDSIENGTEYVSDTPKILPNEDFSLPDQKEIRKGIRNRNIFFIVVFVIACIASLLQLYSSYNEAKRIDNAVSEYYEEFDVIDTISIFDGKELVGSLCICYTDEDGLIAEILYLTEEGDIFMPTPITNIGFDRTYYMQVYVSGRMLSMQLLENEEDIPLEANTIFDFELHNKTYYLCIMLED